MNVTLLEPQYLLLGLLLVPIFVVWHRRQRSVSHSKIRLHSNIRSLSLVAKLPMILFALALISLTVARAQPAIVNTSQQQVIESRDIIIAVDISGSMDSTMDGKSQYSTPDSEKQPRRIDVARAAVSYFIQQRPADDRIALLGFSDDTYYYWPLSSDHKLLLQKASLLKKTTGGTNFDGPSKSDSRIGPFQAAIDHFKAYGQSKTKVFVLVTDGEATISPERFAYLTKELDRMGVRLYVIGAGSDWQHPGPGAADLVKMVAAMHGTIILAGDAHGMKLAMDDINATEKFSVTLDEHVEYRDIYPYFVLAGLALLALFLFFNFATRRTA